MARLRSPLEANRHSYRDTEISKYRDTEIPRYKVRVGSRYDPPCKLEKGDDFIDKVVQRLQLLSKASGFRFRV